MQSLLLLLVMAAPATFGIVTVPSRPQAPVQALPSARLPALKPTPPSRLLRGPQPRQAAQDYLRPADYPPAAIAMGAQGKVRFVLTVDGAGRAADCTVTVSSGSLALDAATCRLMRARTRFAPAIDRTGNPAPALIEQQVEWRLPG